MCKVTVTGTLFRVDGSVEEVTITSFTAIQKMVGGDVEVILRLKDGRCILGNEDGLPLGLPTNPEATAFMYRQTRMMPDAMLVGPIVVMKYNEIDKLDYDEKKGK